MKYIANPVEVDAFKIEDVIAVSILSGKERGDLRLCRSSGVVLRLEDGRLVDATPEMTARMTPRVGDYWVIQADGYVYLNPKDVFERKYHKAE